MYIFSFQGADIPKSDANRKQLEEFLTSKGIPWQPYVRASKGRPKSGDTKGDLERKVREFRDTQVSEVEAICAAKRITFIKLPPFHPEECSHAFDSGLFFY